MRRVRRVWRVGAPPPAAPGPAAVAVSVGRRRRRRRRRHGYRRRRRRRHASATLRVLDLHHEVSEGQRHPADAADLAAHRAEGAACHVLPLVVRRGLDVRCFADGARQVHRPGHLHPLELPRHPRCGAAPSQARDEVVAEDCADGLRLDAGRSLVRAALALVGAGHLGRGSLAVLWRCLVCLVWCGVVWCGVVWCGVVWCGGESFFLLCLSCFRPPSLPPSLLPSLSSSPQLTASATALRSFLSRGTFEPSALVAASTEAAVTRFPGFPRGFIPRSRRALMSASEVPLRVGGGGEGETET